MLRREIRNYPSHIFLSSKMGVLNVQRCNSIEDIKISDIYPIYNKLIKMLIINLLSK